MVHRVAALDFESCNSKKCQLECIRFCPVNLADDECIVLGDTGKAVISEELCTGCGICIKKCPFEAITILNLAEELKEDRVHQYGVNTFRLYRLPLPKKGQVVGLVGGNGIGKTTALNILSGNLKPNLGRWEDPPKWEEVLDLFVGTELKSYMERIMAGELRASLKPQAVYEIPHLWKADGRSLLEKYDERGVADELGESLSLSEGWGRDVNQLSGGELQRLAVAVAAARDADFYFFDEPSSYNDIYQRLAVSRVIRGLAEAGKYVMLVEHDLTFLDYMSDYVHVMYGEAGVYGIVAGITPARTGINLLLDGYIPAENVRFRDSPVVFQTGGFQQETPETAAASEYTGMVKNYKEFKLTVEPGSLKIGEIVGVLGANALGKTTFAKMLAGLVEPDEGRILSKARVSYKPQYLSSDYDGSVAQLLEESDLAEVSEARSQFETALGVSKLMDKDVSKLSGGELQRVAIYSCLSREADIYALDEPSAFIDIEDRISFGKAIQHYVRSYGKSALIVDHDLQLIDIVADVIMIFSGESSVRGLASPPLPKDKAMNRFLKDLGVTYRRDFESGRPRVNKSGSKLDREQKDADSYYYLAAPET